MRLQQMVDEVRMVFPQTSHTYITMLVNQAIREFTRLTRLPFFTVDITDEKDVALTNTANHVWVYDFPDTVSVYEVHNVNQAYEDEWEVRDGKLYLGWVDESKELRIVATILPPSLTVLSNTPEYVPEEFHDALVSRVIVKLAAFNGKVDVMQMHTALWRDAINEAKRYYNTRTRRNADAAPQVPTGEVVGTSKMHYAHTSLVAGENDITFTEAGFTDTAYVVQLNGNSVECYELDPSTNRTTTSLKVWSAASNDNFDIFIIGA